jgi:hypothetical protein
VAYYTKDKDMLLYNKQKSSVKVGNAPAVTKTYENTIKPVGLKQDGGTMGGEDQQAAMAKYIITEAQKGTPLEDIAKKVGMPVEKIQAFIKSYIEHQKAQGGQQTQAFRRGGALKSKAALLSTNLSKFEKLAKSAKKPIEITEKPKVEEKCKGGRVFKKKKGGSPKPACGCSKGLTKIFKNGGVVSLEEMNVILAGPSHDDENGIVEGEKGMPVVMAKMVGKDVKFVKVAEVEGGEAIMSAKTINKLEDLVAKAKKHGGDWLVQLGRTLREELTENSQDLTQQLKAD